MYTYPCPNSRLAFRGYRRWTLAWRELCSVLVVGPALLAGCTRPDPAAVVLATTTSVEDSGLLAHLIHEYGKRVEDARIRPLAVGSGEALELGRRGDADVLIVHHPAAEEAFMAEEHGLSRTPFMFNDFVIVGPVGDPAGVGGTRSVVEAFRAIAGAEKLFLSRGDDSGTHGRERELWALGGIHPEPPWYVDAGQGMGALLQMASEQGAYALSDRATFLALEPRLALQVLYEEDPLLRNVYSVILVRGSRSETEARAFAAWLSSPDGREAVESFEDERGRPLFKALLPRGGMHDQESRSEPQARERVASPESHGSAPAGTDADEAGSDRLDRATLRQRFLCRSVPPEFADSACG